MLNGLSGLEGRRTESLGVAFAVGVPRASRGPGQARGRAVTLTQRCCRGRPGQRQGAPPALAAFPPRRSLRSLARPHAEPRPLSAPARPRSSLQNRAGVRSGARSSRRRPEHPALPQLRPHGRGARGPEPAGGAAPPPVPPPPFLGARPSSAPERSRFNTAGRE
ncbi:putative uncharacterized protein PAK6-AS1 [Melospiza georgiana]|uniref:putative uncharacterized protein PAK6-AS1 n=1 Tax=Melospiza georgiana TaxID=44398 RepID=UPI0025AC0351|nr:putative uncharacterized protein PAK6-AS1 [Melospiza georgiana]